MATLLQVQKYFDCPFEEIKALSREDREELKQLLDELNSAGSSLDRAASMARRGGAE